MYIPFVFYSQKMKEGLSWEDYQSIPTQTKEDFAELYARKNPVSLIQQNRMKIYALSLLCLTLLLWGCEKEITPPIAQEKTVSLWTTTNPDFWEALGKEFDAQHPDMVRVEVKVFENDTILQKELVNRMAEGASPDIILTESDWMIHNTKKLNPHPDKIALSPDKYRELFFPVNHHLVQGDQIWGIPIHVRTLALIYNQEHLLERPQATNDSPIQTWEQIQTLTPQLTQYDQSFARIGYSGIALGDISSVHHSLDIFLNMLLQRNESVYNPLSQTYTLTAKSSELDETEKIDILSLFTSFASDGSPLYTWNKWMSTDTKNLNFETFAQGKVSMIFGYPEDIEAIQSIIESKQQSGLPHISPFNIAFTNFPYFERHDRKLFGTVHALGVPFGSKNPKVAWQFLTFASKKEYMQAYFLSSGLPPARKDLLEELKPDPRYAIWGIQASQSMPLLFDRPSSTLREYLNAFFLTQPNTENFQTLEDHLNRLP